MPIRHPRVRPRPSVPALAALIALAAAAPATADWPAFRGTGASLATTFTLPVTWTAPRWTQPLDGYGQSSPVIVGHTIYVTTVDGPRQQRHHVAAFDLVTGARRWQRTIASSREVDDTDYTSKAASTPVADADGVVVILPTGQLLALAADGATRWSRDLAAELSPVDVNHGYGSSLGQTRDLVIVQMTARGPSYLAAFAKTDGALRWKVDRAPGVAWTSPLVFEEHGEPSIIVSAAGRVECFAAATGELRWSRTDITVPPIATPTIAGTHLIVAGTDRGVTQALGLDRRGETIWEAPAATTDFSSPLVAGGMAFLVNKVGGLTALDAGTGETLWTTRLPGGVWASAIASESHVYFFTVEGGHTVVLRPDGTRPDVVATNTLPVEGRVYGVAAAPGWLVIRTGRTLMSVAADAPTTAPGGRR